MGKTQTNMALSLFNTSLFPALERRMAQPRMVDSFLNNNMFADFGSSFAEMDARRAAFLSDMQIDEDMNHSSEQQQGPYSQCYSYSSSTTQRGDGAPVTHSQESFRTSGGQQASKRIQSMGDKMVEETVKDGETTRTLKNLSEAELAEFNDTFSQQHPIPALAHDWKQMQAQLRQVELPGALEADLAKMQQGSP